MAKKEINKAEEIHVKLERVGHKQLALVDLDGEYAIKVSCLSYTLLTKTADDNKIVDEDYNTYYVCGYYTDIQQLFLKLIYEKTLTKAGKYDIINIDKYVDMMKSVINESKDLVSKINLGGKKLVQ